MRRILIRSAIALVAACGCMVASGQEPAELPLPQFPGTRVDQVTVDVVVLDKKGKPVAGLTRGDFTVLEEGRQKDIANFEFIDRRSQAGPDPEVQGESKPAPRIATNSSAATDGLRSGRSFVVLFDDLNLSLTNAHNARTAVAAFLDQGAVEGDQVTLIATSGAAWWSTRMKGGRADLVAILKRLDGRRIPETATERITDHEAVQIAYFHDTSVGKRVQDRLERYGSALLQSQQKDAAENEKMNFMRGVMDPFVENRAHETYIKMRTRVAATLKAIERAIGSLSEGRDRKSLVLVSEGFAYDPSQEKLRVVVEAARRSNAAIYFIDAAGFRALDPMYSAEFGPALDSRDTMTAIADLSREGEGAVNLSADTGGFSIRGNDFGKAARIGEESQAFYLLGYDPGEVPKDGRFRKIEVKVRGGSYTVRARRGYFAPELDGKDSEEKEGGPDPVLQAALDAPTLSPDLPLRMTAYAMEDEALGKVRVVVAADVDISRVDFGEVEGKSRATLDTILVVAHRDSGDSERVDQLAEIELKPGVSPKGPAWYSFLREVVVPTGQYQAKLVVRDAKSRRVGTVVHEFGIPSNASLRVSTPVLTDTLTQTPNGPVPALLARRTFTAGGQLVCRFDVYGAAKGPKGLPSVRAGHAIRRPDGTVAGRATPTFIEPTSLGALARMVQIPLSGLPVGDYDLALTVSDDVAGVSREIIEPFTVVAPVASSR
jgi:VWFA-related protein